MNNNNWLDIDVLEDYLDGKLDPKTMHRVERLSLEDPFVAEALAGLSLSPKRVQSLSLLQKQLQDRIVQKPVEQKRWQITSQRLSIAAAAAVLFVTVSLLFWMRESSNRDQIAANTPKKVEVAIAQVKTTKAPSAKTKDEVEKVIAEAKTSTYASRSNKVAAPAAIASLAAIIQPNQSTLVKGIVYDEYKSPIPGVSVKLNGSSLATATNAKGEFSLTLDSLLEDPKLRIGSIGFVQKEVSAKMDQNMLIELKTNNSTLNEAVIVGYGAQKKQAMVGSVSKVLIHSYEPEGGLNKFEEYVLNNNKLLIDKKLTGRFVTITFELDKNGTPIHVKALKTLQEQTDAEKKEAIRLVKEGPKWILQPNSIASSTKTVDIKF